MKQAFSAVLAAFFLGALTAAAQTAPPSAAATPAPTVSSATAATPSLQPGQAPSLATEGKKESQMNPTKLLDLIEKGGLFFMVPLGLLSFLAVLLIVFYMLTIREGTVVSDKFMNAADALIRKQDYLGLIAVCNRENECIARIVYKTLDFATKNPTASFDEVREVTEAEGTRQASILNNRISYLNDIGRVAPMIGLMGTVWGMIKTFDEVGQGREHLELAPGIAQALITTAAGLVIAIPALIFYSIFRGKVQKLIAELEAAMTHIMALLAAQYKRANYRASARRDSYDTGAE
ncbi:MAG: MotA/TolQ/ExbB proton channel family protein [Verrucomicrobiales bacterium]|mgnify:CR=1 FL=1